MAEEKNSIFRKKTLEAVQSPEVLNDYLKVTSPGIWIFLAGVVCLLIGVFLWGIFGTIQTSADVVIVAGNGTQTCIVPYEVYESVLAVGEVQADGNTYRLDTENYTQGALNENTDSRILIEGNMAQGDYVVAFPITDALDRTGVYAASVVTETIKPISLLLQ